MSNVNTERKVICGDVMCGNVICSDVMCSDVMCSDVMCGDVMQSATPPMCHPSVYIPDISYMYMTSSYMMSGEIFQTFPSYVRTEYVHMKEEGLQTATHGKCLQRWALVSCPDPFPKGGWARD